MQVAAHLWIYLRNSEHSTQCGLRMMRPGSKLDVVEANVQVNGIEKVVSHSHGLSLVSRQPTSILCPAGLHKCAYVPVIGAMKN